MRRAFQRDRRAVSEVVGNILILGITVITTAAFGTVLLAMPGAIDEVHADLTLTVHPGADGAWNTGNEEIRLQHLGGESFERERTTIIVGVGSTNTRLTDPNLGAAFADDEFKIGETWTRVTRLRLNDEVALDVVSEARAGSSLSFAGTLVVGGGP